MNNKIAFPELVELLAAATNSSKRLSELFLKELFATISQALIDGESVKVKGIGVFKLTKVSERKSVDVNTGEEIAIPSHNKLTFVPDKGLAEEINKPFAQFETTVLSDEVTAEALDAVEHEAEAADGDSVVQEDVPQPEAEETGTESEDAADTVGEDEAADEVAGDEDAQTLGTETADEGEGEIMETPPPFVVRDEDISGEQATEEEPQSQPLAEGGDAADDAETAETEEHVGADEGAEGADAETDEGGVEAASPAQATENAEAETECGETGDAAPAEAETDEVESDIENETEEEIVLPSDYQRMSFEKKLKNETHRALLRGFLWGVLVGAFACGVAGYLLYTVGGQNHQVTDAEVILDTLAENEAAVPMPAGADGKDTTKVAVKETPAAPQNAAEPNKVVRDTVGGRTLMGMSTKHYGKWCFWVYIYEENKDKIGNPNNMKPGTVLVIPPAEKYGIDPHDKESVKKAKDKSFAILKRYEHKQSGEDDR